MHLDPKQLKIHPDKLKKIIRIGIPAGLQGCIFSLSNVVVQSTVNSFGKTVVAGNAAGQNIDGFLYIAMNSFYHTTLAFVGQNVGANKLHRIKKSSYTAAACGGLRRDDGCTCLYLRPVLLGLYAPETMRPLPPG